MRRLPWSPDFDLYVLTGVFVFVEGDHTLEIEVAEFRAVVPLVKVHGVAFGVRVYRQERFAQFYLSSATRKFQQIHVMKSLPAGKEIVT